MEQNRNQIKKFNTNFKESNQCVSFQVLNILGKDLLNYKSNIGKYLHTFNVTITANLYINKKIIQPFQQIIYIENEQSPKIEFNYLYKDLEEECIIGINIWNSYVQDYPIASTIIHLFDRNNKLVQGKYSLILNTNDMFKIDNSCCIKQGMQARMEVQLPEFSEQNIYNFNLCQEEEIFQEKQWDTHYISDLDFINQREDLNPSILYVNNKNEDIKMLVKLSKQPILEEYTEQIKLKVFQNRKYLTEHPECLLLYLCSIDWKNQEQLDKIPYYLNNWANIDYVDALFLLSRRFCANAHFGEMKQLNFIIQIRDRACLIIQLCSQKQIKLILLQLVQALRYEQLDQKQSSLVQLLLTKELLKDLEYVVELYWLLNVETHTGIVQISAWYKSIQQQLRTYLQSNKGTQETISDQINFKNKLNFIGQQLKLLSKPTREQKIEELRRILRQQDQMVEQKFQHHYFSLNCNILLEQIIVEESSVFNSKACPLKICFNSRNIYTMQQQKFNIIYKQGDDLRQDYVIIQIIRFIDHLLKELDSDFKLTPYKIQANSFETGFVEFVPHSTTIASVLNKNKKLSKYFCESLKKKNNPIYDEYRSKHTSEEFEKFIETKQGFFYDIVLNNYILSCAGYSVITYILGIGDRHLDNIMVDITGKMFHIDFGFILGNDCKTFSSKTRLSDGMIEPMLGKKDNFYYKKFLQNCLNLFVYLRKYARQIISLFYMMLDSGIPEISIQRLKELQERFQLGLDDIQAQEYFKKIIQDSLNAIMPDVYEFFHYLQVTYRN